MKYRNLSPGNKKKIEDAYVSLLLSQTKLIDIYCSQATRGGFTWETKQMFSTIEETRRGLEKMLEHD
jgi:hypothetical protein